MNARARRMVWVSSLIMVCAAILLLFLFDPVRTPIFPGCPFHRITGLNCPGCGSSRALHELLHGNLAKALQFNAILILSLPLFAWLGFRLFRQEFSGGPAVTVRPVWVWTYLGVWIAFSILRELPFLPFTALAP